MNNLFSLEGKTIIFTGGAGNLGRTMVKALLEYGANVAVPDIADRFDESFDEYKKNGKLFFVETDLSKTESIKECFKTVFEKYGAINVLVNCAAYGGGAGGKGAEHRIEYIEDSLWEGGIDGTLNVSFRCIREVLPYFYKVGGGNIINFGSMYGLSAPDLTIYEGKGVPSPPFYGAGKAGLIQLTRYAASALANRNIRVNSLSPGPFPNITPATDMEFIERLSNKTMLKRTGKPEELNGAIVFLCSDASSYMTGENITVDGGMTHFV